MIASRQFSDAIISPQMGDRVACFKCGKTDCLRPNDPAGDLPTGWVKIITGNIQGAEQYLFQYLCGGL